MKRTLSLSAASLMLAMLLWTTSKGEPAVENPTSQVKRVGMVVGIKPEMLDEYKRLHAAEHPGVRDLLAKYHLHNFNIFLQQMPDGNWYEFGYYEYTGADFKADMAQLDEEPRNIEWLKKCDPMQIPLSGADGWTVMEQVYYNP